MDVNDLYRALEFSHYASQLRNHVMCLGFSRNTPFKDLVLDLKVLSAYGIKVIIMIPDPKFELEREIALSNAHGTNFSLIQAQEPKEAGSYDLRVNLNQIEAALKAGEMPVIAHHGLTPQTADVRAVQKLGQFIAIKLKAKKVMFVSRSAQLLEDALTKTRITYDQLDDFYDRLREADLHAFIQPVEYVQSLLEAGISEVTHLVGKPGVLCKEVFTHEGAGILFSKIEHKEIRQAELRDISDIAFQIRAQIEAGRILPVDESSIAENLHNFWVYEINGQIIATMRFKEYDDYLEIATGSTIFRDRHYGRAAELFFHMLEEAKKRGAKAVFGVGISPKMEANITPLGFKEINRTELPESWQKNYDMDRPSRAFILDL